MPLEENLKDIQNRITLACHSVGRDPKEVTLVAVTKNVEVPKIMEAYRLGLRHFGESRLQEALPKIEQLPKDIYWHFIGKLQTNKARRVAEHFYMIHSLESMQQVREIEKAHKKIKAFIQINLSKETQKSGIFLEELDSLIMSLPQSTYLQIVGFMTITPNLSDPESIRQYYHALGELATQLKIGPYLSMGMSNDFEIALEEGATHVRIGKKLFGF